VQALGKDDLVKVYGSKRAGKTPGIIRRREP